jgi:hypothetical protein
LCSDGASLPSDGTAVAFVILVLHNFGARASVAAQEDRGNKRSHPALKLLCSVGVSLPSDGTAAAFVILVLHNFGARASVAAQEDRGNKRSHPALKLLLNKCVHAMRGELSRWQGVKVV